MKDAVHYFVFAFLCLIYVLLAGGIYNINGHIVVDSSIAAKATGAWIGFVLVDVIRPALFGK